MFITPYLLFIEETSCELLSNESFIKLKNDMLNNTTAYLDLSKYKDIQEYLENKPEYKEIFSSFEDYIRGLSKVKGYNPYGVLCQN